MLLASTSQSTLNSVSRFFAKHPHFSLQAVRMHLLAGDIMNATKILSETCQKNGIFTKQSPVKISPAKSGSTKKGVTGLGQMSDSFGLANSHQNHSSTPISPLKSTLSTTNTLMSSNDEAHFPVSRLATNNSGKDDSRPPTPSTGKEDASFEVCKFDELLDRLWELLRIYPFREVQTVVIVNMFAANFPIYNRISNDLILLRLLECFLELPDRSGVQHSTSSSKFSTVSFMGIRER
jgi:hypothetical protein